MIVKCFVAVGGGLATSAVGDLVESSPKSLENFTIDHACSWDEGRCIPSVAVIYMAMNME